MNPNIELQEPLFWIKGVEDALKIEHPKKPIYKCSNIIGEGPESSEELNDETLGVTEQGI